MPGSRRAAQAGSLAGAREHAEHVLNLIYTKGEQGYGDYNGNGIAEDVGDGYGIRQYVLKTHQTASQLAALADATPYMSQQAQAVQTTVGNIASANVSADTWTKEVIANANAVFSAATAAEAQSATLPMVTFSLWVSQGKDSNGNGSVEPIAGEGGAATAYTTIQSIADYFPEARPTGSDAFEDDDSCTRAQAIAADETAQARTFHDSGDSDWLRFQVRTKGTYVIQIENLGTKADAMLFLYNGCDAAPSISEDNPFGDVRLEWDAMPGTYYLKLQQYDPDLFGADTDYRISVTSDTTAPSTPSEVDCVAVSDTVQAVQWVRSPERDVDGYTVTYRKVGGGHTGNKTIPAAQQTFTQLEDLAPGSTYEIEVRAFDFSGNLSLPPLVPLTCTVAAGLDSTNPSVSIQLPAATDVFSTTAGMITISGLAEDSGDNLSRVRVLNTARGEERWDYGLSGSSHEFRVTELPLNAGNNPIQITVFDRANNATQQTVVVNRLATKPGAVIIIAGQNETQGLQTNIYNSTNRAYRIFQQAGFGVDDIFYLAPEPQDANSDGVPDSDGTVSPAAVEQAVSDAKGRLGAGLPLYLYLMDHGLSEKFCLTGCNSGFISPTQLGGWLAALKAETGASINVIIEACLSGSFIDKKQVVDSLAREPGWVVISSTDAVNNAYASAQGAYFSDAFFSCLADGDDLRSCFDQAKAAVEATGTRQEPLLDDNGDGRYDPGIDGAFAAQVQLTRFFSAGRPVIQETNVTINGTDGVLEATVAEGAESVELVWAEVYRPTFLEPDKVTLNLDVPKVQLQPVPDQPGLYRATYPSGFTEQGEYRVIFHAEDRLGIGAQPRLFGEEQQFFLPDIRFQPVRR